ncbi:transposase [Geminocystis herdmanii]|uniref:transposase n=1 Tax=Geminocystis herdmanii TaxID=669359 RepID=UPI000346C6C7|nr:transposase [Geminocystis herdmanii]
MKYNPDYHHRRSIRLPNYDYSQSGIYFVTICTAKKQHLFGEIRDGKMFLNQIGNIVAEEWLNTEKIRKEVVLDEWIIMPNHFHGLVAITHEKINNISDVNHIRGANLAPLRRKPRSLSSLVGGFKSAVTKRIKQICNETTVCVWQKNYYESIIRSEEHLNNVRKYIINNPQKWDDDPENNKNHPQELLIDLPF